MPYMKSGQPWLYDEASGDIVGVKDSDGGERFFQARRKTEVAWQGVTGMVLTADTDLNLVSLLKAIPQIPVRGTLAPFFNTTSNKLNAFNEDSLLAFKINLAGTWSGGGTNSSMRLSFLGTIGNVLTAPRNAGETTDTVQLATFFSIDVGDFIALNGTTPIIRANSRTFTVSEVLLIVEQMTHLPNISAV